MESTALTQNACLKKSKEGRLNWTRKKASGRPLRITKEMAEQIEAYLVGRNYQVFL